MENMHLVNQHHRRPALVEVDTWKEDLNPESYKALQLKHRNANYNRTVSSFQTAIFEMTNLKELGEDGLLTPEMNEHIDNSIDATKTAMRRIIDTISSFRKHAGEGKIVCDHEIDVVNP